MSKGRGCNKVKQIKYIWRVFATVSIIFGRGKLKTKTILGGFVSFFFSYLCDFLEDIVENRANEKNM